MRTDSTVNIYYLCIAQQHVNIYMHIILCTYNTFIICAAVKHVIKNLLLPVLSTLHLWKTKLSLIQIRTSFWHIIELSLSASVKISPEIEYWNVHVCFFSSFQCCNIGKSIYNKLWMQIYLLLYFCRVSSLPLSGAINL